MAPQGVQGFPVGGHRGRFEPVAAGEPLCRVPQPDRRWSGSRVTVALIASASFVWQGGASLPGTYDKYSRNRASHRT